MPTQRAQDPGNDAPGMEPNEALKVRGAAKPAPDEPGAEEAEGHIRGRASEPAPDEPGADMNPDEGVKIKF